MESPDYVLTSWARMMLVQLDPDEQASVRAELSSLFALPMEQWPTKGVKRLEGDPPLYLAPLGDTWRAFIQVPPGRPPEVQDVVHKGRLEAFAKFAAAKAE